jgi:hypothetical protein
MKKAKYNSIKVHTDALGYVKAIAGRENRGESEVLREMLQEDTDRNYRNMAVLFLVMLLLFVGGILWYNKAHLAVNLPPTNADQTIAGIMDQFDKISKLDTDRKGQIEKINSDINKAQAPMVDELKAKLRMLHVLNAERADQLVDENIPGLWGDGKTVGPIWVRKTKKTEPFIPGVPQTTAGVKK